MLKITFMRMPKFYHSIKHTTNWELSIVDDFSSDRHRWAIVQAVSAEKDRSEYGYSRIQDKGIIPALQTSV